MKDIIKDKMIEDIVRCDPEIVDFNLDFYKKKLKEKNYEVEPNKSKRGKAKNYYNYTMNSITLSSYPAIRGMFSNLNRLYEKAVEELEECITEFGSCKECKEQQKPKIDVEEKKTALENLQSYLKYSIAVFDKNGMNVSMNISSIIEKAISELQQKSVIGDNLIKDIENWIKSNRAAKRWHLLDIEEACEYFKRLLKQLK